MNVFVARTLNAAFVLSTMAAFSSSAVVAETAVRPNILLCMADDLSYEHVGAHGCQFVQTPAFDRIAAEGVLFRNAFVSSPSCCPSRATALTGLPFYRLGETSMNHTIWARGLTTYPQMLGAAGYHIGSTGKGWGPGNWRVAGLEYNPAGPEYNELKNPTPSSAINPIDYAANFLAFLQERPEGAPFCFWYGGIDPHRVYEDGSGVRNGKRLEDIELPPFYPDSDAIRGDLADYALHVDWFDRHLGLMLKALEEIGELQNTLVIVTSDNGMPFPRAKATLYDEGTHMPFAVMWGGNPKAGRVVDDFVSLMDVAPTVLQVAGLGIPKAMVGKSLIELLKSDKSGQIDPSRNHVVMGVERHFPGGRAGGEAYPIRALRDGRYLYIHNATPDLWPVGDPEGPVWPLDDPTGGFGDSDGGPTKTYLVNHRAEHPRFYNMAFGKRPEVELFDVHADPHQLKNLANDPEYQNVKQEMGAALTAELKATQDPRAIGDGDFFDDCARKYSRVPDGITQ